MPARFDRPVLLIVGCGDIGLRVAKLLAGRWRLLALSSTPERAPLLRAAGVRPLAGNLDQPATLQRLAGLADAVLHLAPPPAQGTHDPRTRELVRALARKARVRCVVYASTSGVYGDCAGARFDETRPPDPQTERARRRLDAERWWRAFGRGSGTRISVLRIPGIYAADRAGADPRQRLVRGTPLLYADEDVYTNHVHADDLARACVAALHRGAPQRVVHVCDDSELKMGDWFDVVADVCGLPRAPRISREEAGTRVTAAQGSFMNESRRLVNRRLKNELRVRLRYPTVREGIGCTAPPAG